MFFPWSPLSARRHALTKWPYFFFKNFLKSFCTLAMAFLSAVRRALSLWARALACSLRFCFFFSVSNHSMFTAAMQPWSSRKNMHPLMRFGTDGVRIRSQSVRCGNVCLPLHRPHRHGHQIANAGLLQHVQSSLCCSCSGHCWCAFFDLTRVLSCRSVWTCHGVFTTLLWFFGSWCAPGVILAFPRCCQAVPILSPGVPCCPSPDDPSLIVAGMGN